jgi:hypothetical protein
MNQNEKADRDLLAKILTGVLKKDEIKRSGMLVGIVDFGSDQINVNGKNLSQPEFDKMAGFYRQSLILQEVEKS